MKVSEVTIEDLKEYCRVDGTEEDGIFRVILGGCKQFIKGQTGLDEETMDTKEDLTIALFILGAEFYENRSYTMTAGRAVSVNPAVNSILAQYCMHIL